MTDVAIRPWWKKALRIGAWAFGAYFVAVSVAAVVWNYMHWDDPAQIASRAASAAKLKSDSDALKSESDAVELAAKKDAQSKQYAETRTGMDKACYFATYEKLQDPDGADLPNYLAFPYPHVPGKKPRTIDVVMPFKARNGFNALRSAVAVCTFKLDANGDPVSSFTYKLTQG